IVSAPMNESELRNLMYTAQLDENTHPFAIRYPRGEGVMPDLPPEQGGWRTKMKAIKPGTGRKLKDGEGVAILSFGHPGNFAAAAIRELRAEELNPAHYDMRFAKPLDESLLHEICSTFDKIITVEDGAIQGGFGSAVLEFMAAHQYHTEIKILGIPDRVIEQGTPRELQKECGYDTAAIADAVREMMDQKLNSPAKKSIP
ncbi:MAG TPA: transketolase C-terminal domain-containing protein, partial [Agriterribacter sp.]|nr:transketolase C-terminal domain-containing protein [Agriterribacter sp.]